MSLIGAKVNKSILIYGFLVLTLFSYILFQNIGERHLYVFLIGVGLGIT